MFVLPVTVPVQRRIVRGSFPRSLAQLVSSVDAAASETRLPALDVLESDTAYILSLDLPGAAKEQLKVSVQGRRVSVSTPFSNRASAAASSTSAGRLTVRAKRGARRSL